jgi:hypothetical protein
MFINVSIALYNTEQEILKADPNDLQERDKRIQRKMHRNPLLEKFYAGQTDEKYVQDYYEVLKKADKFMRKATPHQLAVATNKTLIFNEGNDSFKIDGDYRSNKKDQYGRRYEHYGFFDEKHKHTGKTVGEVIELEMNERRTTDDDLELLAIYSNKPIEVGITKFYDAIQDAMKNNQEFELMSPKPIEFPIKITHNNPDVLNKIEQLTEFLHVKKIGFEHRQLEFFIPLKFKTSGVTDQSEIFNQLTDVKELFIRDEYGELIGYGVTKFLKRIIHKNHEVWKFQGIEMQKMGI